MRAMYAVILIAVHACVSTTSSASSAPNTSSNGCGNKSDIPKSTGLITLCLMLYDLDA